MLFSIIIPAYKRAFLSEAIESVLKQSFGDFELVIVDDCSPEHLDEIISEFKDVRIRSFRNSENTGPEKLVCNWNKCLDLCTGEFVICMGDDDKLCPDCLETYRSMIQRHPHVNLFHGRTRIIDAGGNCTAMQEERPEIESALSMLLPRLEGKRANQYIGDFCFRRSTLLEHGGFAFLPYAWGSDDLTAFQCAIKSGVCNSREVCFQYRESDLTISSNGHNEEKINATAELVDRYISLLDNHFADREQDRELALKCRSSLRKYYRKRAVIHMSYDIMGDRSMASFWMKRRKSINVGASDVLLACIRSMVKKNRI